MTESYIAIIQVDVDAHTVRRAAKALADALERSGLEGRVAFCIPASEDYIPLEEML